MYTEGELYEKLSAIYQYIFLDIEPDKAMKSQQRAKKYVDELKHLIHSTVHASGIQVGFTVTGHQGCSQQILQLLVSGIMGVLRTLLNGGKERPTNNIVAHLFELGSSTDEITNAILALVVGATVELSQCERVFLLCWDH